MSLPTYARRRAKPSFGWTFNSTDLRWDLNCYSTEGAKYHVGNVIRTIVGEEVYYQYIYNGKLIGAEPSLEGAKRMLIEEAASREG